MSAPTWEIRQGDCVAVMATLDAESIDAVVCDPPYGLEFMGKEWDRLAGDWGGDDDTFAVRPKGGVGPFAAPTPRYHAGAAMQAWHEAWAREAYRVMKPGAHLLAFSGTRTYHRLACAIEDAGFEIRDQIGFCFGSGFPKSSRVNRDPRFCQCDEAGRSDDYTDPELETDAHTDTAAPSVAAVGVMRSEANGSREAQDLLGGYLPVFGSGGEPPRPVRAVGQSSVPSRVDVPGRSRSVEHEDGLVAGSSRSPSPVPRNGHHANQGSQRPAESPTDGALGMASSSTPAHRTSSPSVPPEIDKRSKDEFLSAYPHCTACGKPNANGWGTALKPAWEPIVVARKPLRGTVAANVARYGTGGLNVDGCRIGTAADMNPADFDDSRRSTPKFANVFASTSPLRSSSGEVPNGRWPANLVLGCACDGDHDPACASRKPADRVDQPRVTTGTNSYSGFGGKVPYHIAEPPCSCGWRHDPACAVAVLDAQSGELASGSRMAGEYGRLGFGGWDAGPMPAIDGDTGGASRFFYTAKSSRAERERGLEGLAPKHHTGHLRTNDRRNHHPTVKPVDLMQWLVRLVTPVGGLVLDPFVGSGTTGIAALREGFRFLGIDQDVEYCEIARARIVGDSPMFNAPAMAGGA